MSNTINGRTPEEIKKGLECCSVDGLSCSNCSYCVSCDADIHALERDALAYIQQLENHIGELTEMVHQLERERDAAVSDLENNKRCETCINYTPGYFCLGCRQGSNWQWRGVQEVE